ncbi:MAG: hypothetical protein JWO08_3620 [Verrucomicrobiaceae bacterium]|nr:hypothetical protein [Verrucomicrobiaceae bacterium]
MRSRFVPCFFDALPRAFRPATAVALAAAAMGLASCSSLKPADFAGQRPLFEVDKYYSGHTQSTGLIQGRSGEPSKRVRTETWGSMKGGQLHMTQEITLDDGKPTRREWRIRRIDEHHFEAICDHMIGKARGEAWGNTLRMTYVLELQPGNPLSTVRMTHWMQLQPDGHTMLNSVTVTKAGLVVARISEVFDKKR